MKINLLGVLIIIIIIIVILSARLISINRILIQLPARTPCSVIIRLVRWTLGIIQPNWSHAIWQWIIVIFLSSIGIKVPAQTGPGDIVPLERSGSGWSGRFGPGHTHIDQRCFGPVRHFFPFLKGKKWDFRNNEFCEKWDFRNVNFMENGIAKM